MSQSGSGQRTEDEKSNGKVSFSKKNILIKLQLHVNFNFSKASEEIEPSEDLSQSSSDQSTVDEKANGNVSNF